MPSITSSIWEQAAASVPAAALVGAPAAEAAEEAADETAEDADETAEDADETAEDADEAVDEVDEPPQPDSDRLRPATAMDVITVVVRSLDIAGSLSSGSLGSIVPRLRGRWKW